MQRQLKDSYTLLQLLDPKFSAYLEACDASNMYFAFRWLLIWFKVHNMHKNDKTASVCIFIIS